MYAAILTQRPFTQQVKTTLRLRRGTRKPTVAKDRLLRLRHDLGDGLVNKFPVRRQGHAPRPAPFALSDTKRLAASRKRPLRGLHEKSGCRRSNCDYLISCCFVSGEARFVSSEAEATTRARQWRGLAQGLAHWRMAGLAARRRSRPCRRWLSCFARSAGQAWKTRFNCSFRIND